MFCCRVENISLECAMGELHMWNGIGLGICHTFDDYIRLGFHNNPQTLEVFGD
jgi:hypothetical protein